jgi:trimeric autotransporter adhesin
MAIKVGACTVINNNRCLENITNHAFIGNNCNFFAGRFAGSNTTSCRNIFIGAYAGFDNTTGYHNNFIGLCAGMYSQTGTFNNFFGECAGAGGLEFSTFSTVRNTGDSNNFIGAYAGKFNSSGNRNNFIGFRSGLGALTFYSVLFTKYGLG